MSDDLLFDYLERNTDISSTPWTLLMAVAARYETADSSPSDPAHFWPIIEVIRANLRKVGYKWIDPNTSYSYQQWADRALDALYAHTLTEQHEPLLPPTLRYALNRHHTPSVGDSSEAPTDELGPYELSAPAPEAAEAIQHFHQVPGE